nr:hypothetical protein [Tanacetum cinerariifolium]
MVVLLPFTVNPYHDGLFQVNPLEYVHFDSRVIDDVSFDGMSFKDFFFATIRRLVLVSPTSMYYKIPSDPVTALKLLKNDEDLGQFVKACYENNLKIDLFTKHNGYDIIEMINGDLHPKKHVGHVDSDSHGETNVPLNDVAHVVEHFEHENEGNVNIPRMTTDDPWLNKLNDHNKLLAFCGRGVSEGKCAGLNGSTCVLENEVNDEDGKLYFGRDDLNLGGGEGISIISYGHKEIEHNKTRRPNQERPKPAYLRSKGIVFHEAPSTSNTMPPPPIPSHSNTMSPPLTPSPSTINTTPLPFGFNTMPPPPTPSSSNTMPSHATPGSKTSACPNTMPSPSTGTNKGKCPLIPKKRGRPAKSSASSSIGGSRGGVTSKGGSKDDATSRGGSSNRGSNIIPFKGLRDEASDEGMAQDKDMQDVVVGKQPMPEDVATGKQLMIEDEPFQGGTDLPTQESTIKANLKPTRSKEVKVPNQMRILHNNRGRSERIFNQK